MLVFDPVPPKKATKPTHRETPPAVKEAEVGGRVKVRFIPPKKPETPVAIAAEPATPARPAQQGAQPAVQQAQGASPGSMLVAQRGAQDSPPLKKRKRSPLADVPPPTPIPALRLEQDAAPITLEFVENLGFKLNDQDAVLSIYEGMANKKEVTRLNERLPSPLGDAELNSEEVVQLPHSDSGNLVDWFILATRQTYLAFAAGEVHASYANSFLPGKPRDLFIRKGWVQMVRGNNGAQLVILFKSRMAHHDREVAT